MNSAVSGQGSEKRSRVFRAIVPCAEFGEFEGRPRADIGSPHGRHAGYPLASGLDTFEREAGYGGWLRDRVGAGLADPRPAIPHDAVMAEMEALIDRIASDRTEVVNVVHARRGSGQFWTRCPKPSGSRIG